MSDTKTRLNRHRIDYKPAYNPTPEEIAAECEKIKAENYIMNLDCNKEKQRCRITQRP